MAVTRRPPRPYASKIDKDTAYLLGELKSGFDAMREDLAEIKANALRADDSRREIVAGIDHVNGRIGSMEGTVDRLTSDVNVLGGVVAKHTNRLDEVEPVVRKWSLRGGLILGGLIAVGTAASGGLWWLLSSNWTSIVKLIVALSQKQP